MAKPRAPRQLGMPGIERPVSNGFDFTHHMTGLCRDMVNRLPDLAHIDIDRVAVCVSQARKKSQYGTFASLTPMRFRLGAPVERRRDQWYTTQRLTDRSGREQLYILKFYLPRFMDMPLTEKLTTIVHELWHISPDFDGDLRRHEGRCFVHSGSQRDYDAHAASLADQWLQLKPPAGNHAFLKHSFQDIQRIYGGVYGTRVRRPKLIPISAERAAEIAQNDQIVSNRET